MSSPGISILTFGRRFRTESCFGVAMVEMKERKTQDIIRKLYMNHSIQLQHPHKCTRGLTYNSVDVIYIRGL